MSQKEQQSLFKKLTRLFASGPSIRRKVKIDSGASHKSSSAVDIFQRARSDIYSSVLSSYGSYDRMARYSDFSEMEATPEIASALDIYAEETVAQDEKGVSLHINSDNRKIQELLETLFYDTLNVSFNLPMWVRNLCKYGDFFLFLDVSEEYGIINAYPIPIAEMEREEGFNPENPSASRFRWISQGNTVLENWQVGHFRLLGNDAFLPYGTSVLESARRIWRQLILMEDAMLVYRVIRAPERRVFYIDVGNIPPDAIASYMEEAKSSLKRQPIVDKTNGRVDLRYNPYPVWSGSIIPLLDGRHITIKELAQEFDSGAENWVYSINDETHEIMPGKVIWCGKNYDADRLTKVWLDDDTWVMTAPEHPFILRDGTQIRADKLEPGMSLMPFYREVDKKNYESCYDPKSGKYIKTHKIVARDVYPEEWQEKINKKLVPVVHHKEPWKVATNKRNNHPQNLEVMDYYSHRKWHIDHIQETLLRPDVLKENAERLTKYNKSAAKKLKTTEDNKKYKKAEKMGAMYNGSDLHKSHNKNRKEGQLVSWAENKEERSKAMRWIIPVEMKEYLLDAIRNNPKLKRQEIVEDIQNNVTLMNLLKEANKGFGRNPDKFNAMAILNECKEFGDFEGWGDFRKLVAQSGYKNHKVVRVEEVIQNDEVYCMTVVGPNGEQDRHNFAMCSMKCSNLNKNLGNDEQVYDFNGVFVRNSIDEDYFLPVRGGESGTKIDTLAGGTNAAAIEDVQYIQKKLFASLKVPKAYLQYDEDIGAKATLAQEDIRFSRTIARIQKTVISELNKLAMIHLYCHGFDNEDLIDFKLELSNPSSIAQQQKLELISSRFDIAGKAPAGVVDREWIRRHVMNLNDNEIAVIKRGLEEDQLEDLKLQNISETDAAGAGAGGGGGGDPFAGLGGGSGGAEMSSDDLFDTGGTGESGEDSGDVDADTEGEEEPKEESDEEETFGKKTLLTSLYKEDEDDEKFKESDKPVKPANRTKNSFGGDLPVNRKISGGSNRSSMPDFASIVGVGSKTRKQDTSNDPYDKKSNSSMAEIRNVKSQPFLKELNKFINKKSIKFLNENYEEQVVDEEINFENLEED